jgi:hypothetical protein
MTTSSWTWILLLNVSHNFAFDFVGLLKDLDLCHCGVVLVSICQEACVHVLVIYLVWELMNVHGLRTCELSCLMLSMTICMTLCMTCELSRLIIVGLPIIYCIYVILYILKCRDQTKTNKKVQIGNFTMCRHTAMGTKALYRVQTHGKGDRCHSPIDLRVVLFAKRSLCWV